MGKKSSKSQSKEESQPAAGGLPFISGSASLDPTLSSLFAASSGPVQAPTVKYKKNADARKSAKKTDEVEEEDDVMEDASASEESDSESAEEAEETQGRKRKRGPAEEVEETYMRRIAKEEEKDAEKRKAEYTKRQKPDEESDDKSDNSDDDEEEDEEEDKDSDSDDKEEKSAPPPVHESVAGNAKASEVEKSSRTVFLGNVSTEAIKSKSSKKTLLRHLASHLSSLPESSGPHKVESIRFRSVPFASGGGLPKRASFARREILDDTTPSTNAYAAHARPPSALNGTVVLDRHIRVDSIAHPAEIDNKRCVFVGNLSFVDQEGITEDHNGKKKKARASADIEEGLWRIFNQNTGDTKDKKTVKKNVEFVRVIRDRATRVGKGFAYVQFFDANNVEAALLLNEKNYPPMLPRKLRVTRARKMAKKQEDDGGKNGGRGDLAQKTLQGRANKLLGRAGAAKIKEAGKGGIAGNSMVFEGHRATEDGSRMKVKTKSRGSKGKPKGRSSKRAAAYRAAGGQKP
ncbi:Nucleolar protein 12 [Penicillium waksmanii]|uniref:Nucleolar protein 12 n=1 Tax=Penicillium waksmanii TaxID=69791 RepID=UPI002548B5AF|nr:Nucleolar protein 12 [Penicillium waksmanii]KAJ5975268.1 Nucleolar protein 12 [Penicillium waksmanii]